MSNKSSGISLTGSQSIASGMFAGCITRSCTSPMDVLKITLQAQPSRSAVQLRQPMQTIAYNVMASISRTCRELYTVDGIKGFWRGNLAGCYRLGPYCGIKFCVYDTLHRRRDSTANVDCAIDGAMAGMAATLAVYPMEVVRTRLILERSPGILQGLASLYKAEGLRGFYRGGLTGLVGAIPFEGLQFACYELGRGYALEHHWPAWRWDENKTQLSPVDILVTGSLSGMAAQLASYPFDTIKKRLQAQALGTTKKYNGMVDGFRQIVRDEGFFALYRGTLPNMVRITPYAAIMFASTASLSGLQSVTAGAFAGCVTRSATSPLDVHGAPGGSTLTLGASLKQVCRSLYVQEGLRGFWKGNLAGCCRLGPYTGVKFWIFDGLQAHLCSREKPSNFEHAVCGAIAGMFATVSVYPMEVVRTRIIVTNPGQKSSSMGIHRTLQQIYRAEGLRGLYRGGLSGLVGSIPFEGIQFACYEYCKSIAIAYQQEHGKKKLGSVDYLVIGSISGAVAQTVSYPFDSVKKRLQAQELGAKRYNGMTDCFQKVIQEEGVAALFRGTLPNMVRISCLLLNNPTALTTPATFSLPQVCRQLYAHEGIRGFWKGNLAGCFRLGPYSGIKFFTFDMLQVHMCSRGTPSNLEHATCGAIAGMIATMTVYPMEVVRTRIIVHTSKENKKSIAKMLTDIYRVEGLRGLYRGGLSGLVGSIPFEGVQFACYEYCKSYILHRRLANQDKRPLASLDYLAIGSISGAVAQTVSYPFDSVKKRLQAQELGAKRYNGMTDCFQKVIREEGMPALFRGTLPNMVRIVPYSAVMFASYEAAKKFLSSL
ncbi:Mitochondrial Carrier (MC) Family [Thraustotheca clavata]|uniref:Mitochondrial Carrier (MC) Family n=1 Tax=Thraustotheca clavata TaxID=74557 RepID=A0A1W0A5R1_9STRA|nr:Mitochondrial Carrier (MC) Family [Thraustotheca clavata]